MKPRTMLVLLAAATIALAAGCGGDDEGGDGGEDGVLARPTSVDRAGTGDQSLDGTLNAALDGDVIEMAALAGYQHRACEAAPQGASAPACREGEAAGADVEGLPVTRCDLAWVRPEAVPDAFAAALGDQPLRLAAVYRPKPADGAVLEQPAEYVGVIATGAREGAQTAVALGIRGGRIVSVETDCGGIDRLLGEERVASYVVEPRELD